MKTAEEQIFKLTLERDEARKLAEKYRDKYVSNYEDSAMYIMASSTTKLPWEKAQSEN